MLPVAYRVVKGFATFFGVIGVISCICGLIAGIIMNGGDNKKTLNTSGTTSSSSSGSSSAGVGGGNGSSVSAVATTLTTVFWK